MKKSERELLRLTRTQAQLVSALRARCGEELALGLRAISPDTAARRGGVPPGLEADVIRREELSRMLAREEAYLCRLEKKARKVIAALPLSMHSFCVLYYIGAASLDQIAVLLDRSARQCLRYKQQIEEE